MHFRFLLMTVVVLSGQVYAQSFMEASMTSVSEWNSRIVDYTKEHFAASYHGEIYAVRRNIDSLETNDQKMKDFKILHNPTLIYKPTQNWQALASAEFTFSDQSAKKAGSAFPNGFYRSLFTLTRKNILIENEHGIQLDLGIGRRQYNTGREQQEEGLYPVASYGNNRAFATLSKNFGKNNASLFLQYMNNDYKIVSDDTWKNSLEILPTLNIQLTERLSYTFNDDITISTPKSNNTDRDFSITHDMNVGVLGYQFNDQIGTYYQLKYGHTEDFTKIFRSEDDYFLHAVGVGYTFNPKATVTLEVNSELAHARDGKDVFAKSAIYPEMALYLDFAI